MGAMQRRKGRAWEQRVARILRKKWPHSTVRRSLQAHRAYEPDLVIEGMAPSMACALWLELQHADRPNPVAKLDQARRDMAESCLRKRYAVVVWRKTSERTAYATMSMWAACDISGVLSTSTLHTPNSLGVPSIDVTMTLEDFLRMLPE